MKKIILKLKCGVIDNILKIIIGLYIKQINGGTLYIYLKRSPHENTSEPLKTSVVRARHSFSRLLQDDGGLLANLHHPEEPTIVDLFPKLKKYYTIVNTRDEMAKYYECDHYKFKCSNIKQIEDFKLDIKQKTVVIKDLLSCYKYVYTIYDLLEDEMREIFSINRKIITKKILDITKEKYACVHVKYGENINMSLQNNQYCFLMYTPEFYKHIIKKIVEKKTKVYIITDDVNIVKKYILNDIKSKNIILLDIDWWDSLYIMTHAYCNVLSMNIFSFVGCIINKHLRETYIVTRPKEIKEYEIPEENILYNVPWYKKNNKKYILNYDRSLMEEMLSVR